MYYVNTSLVMVKNVEDLKNYTNQNEIFERLWNVLIMEHVKNRFIYIILYGHHLSPEKLNVFFFFFLR